MGTPSSLALKCFWLHLVALSLLIFSGILQCLLKLSTIIFIFVQSLWSVQNLSIMWVCYLVLWNCMLLFKCCLHFAACEVDGACVLLFMHLFSFYLVCILTLFHFVIIFNSGGSWFAVFQNKPASVCVVSKHTEWMRMNIVNENAYEKQYLEFTRNMNMKWNALLMQNNY